MTEIRIEGLRTRTLIFAACLALAFLGLLGRLAYLQVWKHDEYARLAENQHAKTVPLRPKRGPILDRGGQAGEDARGLLATSVCLFVGSFGIDGLLHRHWWVVLGALLGASYGASTREGSPNVMPAASE